MQNGVTGAQSWRSEGKLAAPGATGMFTCPSAYEFCSALNAFRSWKTFCSHEGSKAISTEYSYGEHVSQYCIAFGAKDRSIEKAILRPLPVRRNTSSNCGARFLS